MSCNRCRWKAGHQPWCLAQAFAEELSRAETTLKGEAILEGERRQFHHEVMCLVLKESFRAVCSRNSEVRPEDVADCVKGGRIAADLAYPPPKADR